MSHRRGRWVGWQESAEDRLTAEQPTVHYHAPAGEQWFNVYLLGTLVVSSRVCTQRCTCTAERVVRWPVYSPGCRPVSVGNWVAP